MLKNQEQHEKLRKLLKKNPPEVLISETRQGANLTPSINNVMYIVDEHDEDLKNKFLYEEMSGKLMVKKGSLPWDNETATTSNTSTHQIITGPTYGDFREFIDADLTECRSYLASIYQIDITKNNTLSVLKAASEKNRFNYFVAYLEELSPWDGIERLPLLYHEYLGAADTPLNREIAVKPFVAIIARAYAAGPVKFDYMPLLIGPQGSGKSLTLSRLGGIGCVDSINSFEGKEAEEIIQGKIIAEISELEAFGKSSINRIKQFITKVSDHYRVPYDTVAKTHKRYTVFFGTTNKAECLRDITGGRRFLPVICNVVPPAKNVYNDLDADTVDAIWAEALYYYQQGESLTISQHLLPELTQLQENSREKHPWEEKIANYVERPIPPDWFTMNASERISFMEEPSNWSGPYKSPNLIKRDKISIEEIWTICLGNHRGEEGKNRIHSTQISDILSSLPGWKKAKVRDNGEVKWGARRI